MPARRFRKSPGSVPAAGRRRAVVAVVSVLILVIGSGLLAQVTKKRRAKQGSGEIVPASLNTASKEYIYAGGKVLATEEPTGTVNGDDAGFVSMCVFSWEGCMPPEYGLHVIGVPFLAVVTLINTGTTTWTSASYRLASQNPANNTIWGPSSVSLPTASVAPGSQVTFSFSVTRTGGPFNFQWQMTRTGVGFFGEKTRNAVVPGGEWFASGSPPVYAANFVSQSSPSVMFTGQSYPVSVTMQNGGSATWTTAANYKLGSQSPQDSSYWGLSRVALPSTIASGANATFNFNVSAPQTPGRYNFQWMMVQDGAGGAGFFASISPGLDIGVTTPAALGMLDYNLDRKSDLAVWRPSSKQWLIDTNLNATADFTYTFGTTSSDLPVPGDYNGDGTADLSTVKSFSWKFDFDRNGVADQTVAFGSNGDIPVPQDYNGDKQADIAVFRPSTGQWLVDTNRNGTTDLTVTLGQSGDIPSPADYNGDGVADPAVFRPSTGQWVIDTDRNGTADITITLGQSGDLPVAMDYNGDGIADPAVFRPSSGQWLIDTDHNGSANITVTLGVSGDIPAPADYNGDCKVDIAVFRPTGTKWIIDTNRDGTAEYTLTFGQSSDIPLRQNGWILKEMGILPQ